MESYRTIRAIRILLLLSFTVRAVCAFAAPSEQELPPLPSIERDVNLIYDRQYSRPQIPPLRTTSDGRVALQTRTRSDSASGKVFDFYLMAPEQIQGSFQSSPAGAEILASTTPVALARASFVDTSDDGESFHSAICETQTLPKTCGPSSTHDCYNFSVVTPFHNEQRNRMEIWRTEVEVEVADPKTADAAIVSIATRKPIRGVSWPGISSMLETVMTGDGRLVVGRVAQSPVTWRDTGTGEKQTTEPNVVYGYIPQSQNPCDVSQLRGPYPITHAHYHNAIRNNYGFAAYPMRDGAGRLISNGADFGGSYAWIDSKGNNLFFGTFRQSILQDNEPAFRLRCVGGGQCDAPTENMTRDTIGISVSGLWTKGRTILLDNVLNNVDWNLRARPSGHVEAKLYRGDRGWIHVGSGRDNSSDTAVHMPPGGVGNINFIDSLENKLNAFTALHPSVPRDVAWWVSMGKSTDLVAFDDWVSPYVFINSDMVQSIEGDALEPNYRRIQNAATGRLFNPPRYGEIIGNGRIEPVALGGIRGKGFFNKARWGIRYNIARNRNRELGNQDWYLGIFVDPRFGSAETSRRLIEFPDGSAIDLFGHTELQYFVEGVGRRSVPLPQRLRNSHFNHLGFRIGFEGAIELFFDGMLVDRWQRSNKWKPHFKIERGALWLGVGQAQQGGFSGWLDEFKMISNADDMSAEEFCNHASGSIVGLSDTAPSNLRSQSAALPPISFDFVNEFLTTEHRYANYLCYTDNRSEDGWINLKELPAGVVSLRQPIIFPEGPLVANLPRPDSTGNAFCLSCHHSDGTDHLPDSLTPQALAHQDINAESDKRRQTSQPPAQIFGNVPAGLFGEGEPLVHEFADDGLLIDEYLFDSE